MKDTLLTVAFSKGEVHVWHKTKMGSLQYVFKVGNLYRDAAGKPPLPLATWIVRQDVAEYIEFLKERYGIDAIVRKRGRSGGTFAHLKILIDAATSLDPAFKDEVYETFISNKLLALREDGGEMFKDLNSALGLSAELVLGKPAHKGHFITLAKAIKARCGVEDWNVASAYQLHARTNIEDRLVGFLENDLVRDWDHLKELAEKD